MSRRLPLFISFSFRRRVLRAKVTKEKIKVWARNITIIPEMEGMNFLVHNGMKFVDVFVTQEKIGHKLGEFVLTKIFRSHAKAKDTKSMKGVKVKGKK
jgi:small subunit ribosomal protein S19